MFVFKEGADRVLANFFTSEQIQSMVGNFKDGIDFSAQNASSDTIMCYTIYFQWGISVHEVILYFNSSLYEIDALAIFDQCKYMTIPNETPNNPYARHIWYDVRY